MANTIIIIPTNSSYIEIVKNFLQLLRKNWSKCPYKIVVSITGKNVTLSGVEVLYNGEKASLIDCIVNAEKEYDCDCCICMLGDMFISATIDDGVIGNILRKLSEDKVDYCSLNYVKNYKKEKSYSEELRFINNLDRYSHSFSAFFASRNFIEKELVKYDTDLDFEKSYLFGKESFYYNNHLAVRKNYFNFMPGIIKGKWDRINYFKLKRNNPEIAFEKRAMQSRSESIICHIRSMAIHLLPHGLRIWLKKLIENAMGMRFGVEG